MELFLCVLGAVAGAMGYLMVGLVKWRHSLSRHGSGRVMAIIAIIDLFILYAIGAFAGRSYLPPLCGLGGWGVAAIGVWLRGRSQFRKQKRSDRG